MLNKCSRGMLARTIVKNPFDDVDVFGGGLVNVEIQELLAGVDLDLQDAETAWGVRGKQRPFADPGAIVN